MEFTTDAIITLAAIAADHQLDREMISILFEAACQQRSLDRYLALNELQARADTGEGTAVAILERIARDITPLPVYAENVEEAYRLLTGTEED